MEIDLSTHCHRRRLILVAVLAAMLLSWTPGRAQQADYEEIVVGFEIPRLVKTDLFVQYDGRTVYLPLGDVFSLIGYNIVVDHSRNRIDGFLADKSAKYEVDLTTLLVKAPGVQRHLLPSEYVYDGANLYLRLDLYGELFKLTMQFDFSLLRVLLPLTDDLPAFQKVRRQKLRDKLAETKQAARDVLELPRERDYAKGGVIDWRASTNYVQTTGQNYYYDCSFGGMLLSGDMTLKGGGNSTRPFDGDQFTYRWHRYVEDNPYVSQIDQGEFHTSRALSREFVGAKVSNAPQIQRKYFQTITLADSLGEGWEVELWVDGRMTDYLTTDGAGKYEFNVDVVYGASDFVIKKYGPNGELVTTEQNHRVPYNLIPKGDLEYTAALGTATGRLEGRRYGQASVAYGILRNFTAGASADLPLGNQPDSIAGLPVEDQTLVSLDATYQAGTNLTVGGAVSPSNQMSLEASFTSPNFISANAGMTKYFASETLNPTNQKQRLYLSLAAPIRWKSHNFGLRYNISLMEIAGLKSINMYYGLTASVQPVFLNYTGRYKISENAKVKTTELVSQLITTVGVYGWFRPQFRFDFDHGANALTRYGVFLSRRLLRSGQLTLSYERNVAAEQNQIMLTFNFYTGFFSSSTRAMQTGGRNSISQMQSGSVRLDQENGRVLFDRRTGVGYGTAVVRPFFDANYNGVRDSHEEQLMGLRAKIAGAGGRPAGADLFYYERLRAYDEYLVQIDEYSLDNPLLKPSNEHFRVTLNPNVVTAIDVPIVSASEINGSVVRRTAGGMTAGVGG
jgi:hypothetical protein